MILSMIEIFRRDGNVRMEGTGADKGGVESAPVSLTARWLGRVSQGPC
jgi:hypothetical protein